MIREIVKIDQAKCDGCGLCIPNCHEGALQIIDGKACLVSDLLCDGLGACIGHCPVGAISIEKREAEAYDEITVIKEMIQLGKNVVIAHLQHLKEHGELDYLRQGANYLKENASTLSFDYKDVISQVHNSSNENSRCNSDGCPGSATQSFAPKLATSAISLAGDSALTHWPIQLHLINPNASHFNNADLLLAADCSAFSLGNFHNILKGKVLAIACPKLDSNQEIYINKLINMIDNSKLNTVTILTMEVPCCGGLINMVKNACTNANRKIPIKSIIVSIKGDIISDEWI
jgi:NAD-dependent dihydropyrimidine dehydrogenase PreA subunit